MDEFEGEGAGDTSSHGSERVMLELLQAWRMYDFGCYYDLIHNFLISRINF